MKRTPVYSMRAEATQQSIILFDLGYSVHVHEFQWKAININLGIPNKF